MLVLTMKKTICKHCKDDNIHFHCERCDRDFETVCKDCHNELVHKRLNPLGVHICGNSHIGLVPRQRAKLGKTDGG
jgi:hypothetical protein